MNIHLCLLFCLSTVSAQSRDFNILDFGAVPDGKTLATDAIQKAIDDCEATGTMEEAMAQVPEKEKSYPENRMFGYSLPAYGLYARHVKNLSFENFRFNLRNPDAPPAIVLEDCHDIRLASFDVDTPSDDQPLLRLIQSTNVTLSGYQSTTPVTNFLRVEGETCSDIKLMGNDLTHVKKVTELKDGCKSFALRELNGLR